MNDYEKRILILGQGVSGRAAARLMLREGHDVVILDEGGTDQTSDISGAFEKQYDLCILSPGIPFDHSWVNRARQCSLEILPEFEVGWQRFKGKTLAITGSNGKSTVVKWCAESLQRTGLSAVACGNYGVPVCDILCSALIPDVLVMELSSFQLEAAKAFKPDSALLLNVLPNHLDRHGGIDAYRRLKLSLFRDIAPASPAILPEALCEEAEQYYPGKNYITFGTEPSAVYQYKQGTIRHNGRMLADITDTLYENDVMGASAAATFALLKSFDVEYSTTLDALNDLVPLPHRHQEIGQRNNIIFVNDSKATNLAALSAAVAASKRPVRLIAGGRAKEKNFKWVKEVLAKNTKRVYLIGSDAQAMSRAWSSAVHCKVCGTLDVAVREAWRDASAGETILLSPGCTSFDQFKHFEERGEQFMNIVRTLDREKTK